MTHLAEVARTRAVLMRALGTELRLARRTAGWSREELAERLPADIQPRMLATYEQGVRHCTVTRLVEICYALGVGAPAVLGLALQRSEAELNMTLQVDLGAVLRDTQAVLEPLRQWAAKRLQNAPDGTEVVQLERGAIREMATLLGFSGDDLTYHLVGFAPQGKSPSSG